MSSSCQKRSIEPSRPGRGDVHQVARVGQVEEVASVAELIRKCDIRTLARKKECRERHTRRLTSQRGVPSAGGPTWTQRATEGTPSRVTANSM
jgi:hypothetical protein